jgi:hypothetical protein
VSGQTTREGDSARKLVFPPSLGRVHFSIFHSCRVQFSMEKRALEQARDSLQAAKAAVDQLKDAGDFPTFCRAWSAFLVNSNRIHTKLSAGARLNAKSRQWTGRKQERKKDPLLRYLHQARNSDEHGIEPVAEIVPGSMGIGATPGASVRLRSLIMTRNVIVADADPPEALQVSITPTDAKLSRVYDDRSDTWYEPPLVHQGRSIAGANPIRVAELAITYLETLLAQAESLP